MTGTHERVGGAKLSEPKRIYDFTKVEDIDAAEANLNEVEQSYLDAERSSGLLWTLLTGKRRMDIAAARAAIKARSES